MYNVLVLYAKISAWLWLRKGINGGIDREGKAAVIQGRWLGSTMVGYSI